MSLFWGYVQEQVSVKAIKLCSRSMFMIQPSLKRSFEAFSEPGRVIFPGLVDVERPRLIVGEP